jgi:superfamily II DNA/RNA helicase
MDLLRLRSALLMCRMVANSTFLCDKQEPSYSSKLERLEELLEQVFSENSRKAILFSEWTTMLDQVERILGRLKLPFVRLDGSVPQNKRQALVNEFQANPDCRLFITTNAGSTGLNLQAANTVINCDLPWNPAILEQRIARAHRMGQKRPVQAFLLVTEQTIEESLLATLTSKRELALAALDVDSDLNELSMVSGAEELRSRLEILLGAKPQAAIEERQDDGLIETPSFQAQRERVAAAGGELLGAVFHFLGELVQQQDGAREPSQAVVANLRDRLGGCVEEDADGRQRLSLTLPNRQALDGLATTLAKLLVSQQS